MGWWDRLGGFLSPRRLAGGEGVTTQLKEATTAAPASGYDPDAGLTAAQMGTAYVRRLTGQTDRQLPDITADRAREIAYWLYQSNPLGRRITKLMRDFVLGDGLEVMATAEQDKDREAVQMVIDRFWNDPYNRMDMALHDYVLELGLFGELVLTVGVNPKNGHVRLGYIDASQIKDVVTDKTNVRIQRAVVLKGKGGLEEEVYKVIRLDDDPQSKTYGKLVGLAEGETFEVNNKDGTSNIPRAYTGACFYFRVNGVSNSIRGWPDMLSLIDWIDGFDQMAFNEIDRSLLIKSFVWDITLTGADAATVEQKKKTTGVPKSGSVRIHNEKELWQAVTPDLKAADSSSGIDLLLSVIATGSGLPKTWLNGIMDVNRASATELAEPAFKELTMRQRYVRYMVEHMVRFALDQAEIAGGQLPKRKMVNGLPESWPITVNAPEIRGKDLNQAADTLFKITQALAVAVAEKAIDTELEQEILKLAIGQLGVDVDLEALKARMDKAGAEAEAKEVPSVVPGDGNGKEEEETAEDATPLRIAP